MGCIRRGVHRCVFGAKRGGGDASRGCTIRGTVQRTPLEGGVRLVGCTQVCKHRECIIDIMMQGYL